MAVDALVFKTCEFGSPLLF